MEILLDHVTFFYTYFLNKVYVLWKNSVMWLLRSLEALDYIKD